MQVKGAKLTCNLNHSRMQMGCLALRLPRQQEIKKFEMVSFFYFFILNVEIFDKNLINLN